MPLSPDTKLHYVNTIDLAMDLKRWLGDRRRSALGLDIETSGLSMYTPESRVITIQVGDTETGWVIPVEGWGGVAIEILRAWDGPICFHNAAFDNPWLDKFMGYRVPRHQLHDTMVMAKIMYPGQPATLKGLSVKHVDPNAGSGAAALKKAFKDNDWDWNTIPTDHPAYWIYSALDPVLTAHLYDLFRADEKYSEVYELEMATLNIAMEMEKNGSRIDPEYCIEKRNMLVEFAETNTAWAQENWGVNLNSPQQMVQFFQSLGAQITRRTKGGAPSLDSEMLGILKKSQNEVVATAAQFVVDTKRAFKFSKAYFGNFIDMSENGLLHPHINTIEARTSRMSITKPALQQIPSKDALVRSAFIPRNYGEQIVSVDYSQVELRILANLTKDPRLIADFHDVDNSGGDFFVNMGVNIYGPGFTKSDPRRKDVKSAMYGMNYGAGAPKIAETAGRPVEEIKEVLAGIHSTYPGIQQFQRNTIREIEALERVHGEGWVETEMGRRLSVDKGFAYKGVNYAIQGRAAEVMKRAIVRLDQAGMTPYMMLPVHDEVVSSVPSAEVEDYIRDSEAVMAELEHDVKLVAEGEGPFDRWGDKYS